MELISREMAIDHMRVLGGEDRERLIGILNNKNILPTIDRRPKGKWNWHGDEDICSCPYCDFEIDAEGCIDPVEYVKIYNYCPNCGAQLGVDIGGYDGERVDGGEE